MPPFYIYSTISFIINFMAQNIKIAITGNPNCKSFIVTEKTGIYDPLVNKGGYGTPNIELANINSYEIQVSLNGSSSIYTIDTSADLPSNSNGFVTINQTDIGFLSNQTISDGVYLINYILTGHLLVTNKSGSNILIFAFDVTNIFSSGDIIKINDNNYTVDSIDVTNITFVESITSINIGDSVPFIIETSKYEIFYCSITSCYLDSLTKISVDECSDCNKEALELSSKIETLLQTAKYAAKCGKVNKATQILNYLGNLCNEKNCTTCK